LKPPKFKYIAPESPESIVRSLAEYDGEARCLSGGQSLIPLMNFRLVQPAALIDLNRCPGLSYLRRDGETLVIGPMTRQATVEYSGLVADCCPLIAKTMMYLGSPAIRNRGTIGGTLAHADRTAELPAVAIALGAEMVVLGEEGERVVPAEEFFVGDLATAVGPNEMLREVRFPVSPEGSLSAFVEANNRHHDLALAGVAVYLERADGAISTARIVCHGLGPKPIRLTTVEHRLTGTAGGDEALRHAASFRNDGVTPESDTYASADYRSTILPGLVARALQQAVAAGGEHS
jgi:carbon-monoxide dehydrogenase medium subunit